MKKIKFYLVIGILINAFVLFVLNYHFSEDIMVLLDKMYLTLQNISGAIYISYLADSVNFIRVLRISFTTTFVLQLLFLIFLCKGKKKPALLDIVQIFYVILLALVSISFLIIL